MNIISYVLEWFLVFLSRTFFYLSQTCKQDLEVSCSLIWGDLLNKEWYSSFYSLFWSDGFLCITLFGGCCLFTLYFGVIFKIKSEFFILFWINRELCLRNNVGFQWKVFIKSFFLNLVIIATKFPSTRPSFLVYDQVSYIGKLGHIQLLTYIWYKENLYLYSHCTKITFIKWLLYNIPLASKNVCSAGFIVTLYSKYMN